MIVVGWVVYVAWWVPLMLLVGLAVGLFLAVGWASVGLRRTRRGVTR
jgi:hypothetical protein